MTDFLVKGLKSLGITVPNEYAGLLLPIAVGLLTLLVTIVAFSNVSEQFTGRKKLSHASKKTPETGTKVIDGVRRSTRYAEMSNCHSTMSALLPVSATVH